MARKCLVVLRPSWLLNMIIILLNVLLFGKEVYLHVLFIFCFPGGNLSERMQQISKTPFGGWRRTGGKSGPSV